VQDASEQLELEQACRPHIPTSTLWQYQKKAARLTTLQEQHLEECQNCVAVLIMCCACKSLGHVKTKFKEHGINVT